MLINYTLLNHKIKLNKYAELIDISYCLSYF